MRKLFYISLLAVLACASCKKNKVGNASINIVDAVPDVPALYVYLSSPDSAFYLHQAQLSYGSALEFGLSPGTIPVSLVNTSDTVKQLFKGDLTLQQGKIYSLFLCGQGGPVDTMWIQDHVPYYGYDSVSGLRFVNLCPDCGAVSVNMAGSTNSEYNNLGYKSITDFKSYPAPAGVLTVGGYTFEIRDGSGTLLATATWSLQVFQNSTLVISGLKGNGSVQGFQVNNF